MERWEKEGTKNQRRFFFFYHGKLWKMFISLDVSILPEDKKNFDTFQGVGVGRLKGKEEANIRFTFTDAGEPGTLDTAEILIWTDDPQDPLLYVSGPLEFGNHQAHGK